MSISDLVNSTGSKILLGRSLGKGGEGAVYEVVSNSDLAAKIYLNPMTAERAEKIKAMVSMKEERLLSLMGWPTEMLFTKSGMVPVGLLMPRFDGRKNIHHVYGPKNRIQDFPKADWRFLVRAATNTAKAFAVVHGANCVIGDVNHGSIMVANDATVRLIDCDSFQVNLGTKIFLCDYGVEAFTPPELQGGPFRGAIRTPNFDNFGLAVVVFHLLFMGRHPFAGKFLDAGEMQIARAIKESRFPYGKYHLAQRMEPPPGTPPLSMVGQEVADLFEKSFSLQSITNGRPTAIQWAEALHRLEVSATRCSADETHYFSKHSSSCPWCKMESLGANPLFPYAYALNGQTRTVFDPSAILAEISRLTELGAAPTINVVFPRHPTSSAAAIGPPSKSAGLISLSCGIAAFAFGTVLFPAAFFFWAILGALAYSFINGQFSKDLEVQKFRQVLNEKRSVYQSALLGWQTRAGDALFLSTKSKLTALGREINELPQKRLQELEKLKRAHRKLQLDRFLDRFDLDSATIDGIGPSRKRTLESYGIETAEDISSGKVGSVPGFGPIMIDKLVKWRNRCESKFVFDPSKGIDPRDTMKVEQSINSKRDHLQGNFKKTYLELKKVHSDVLKFRENQQSAMNNLYSQVLQAEMDVKYLGG